MLAPRPAELAWLPWRTHAAQTYCVTILAATATAATFSSAGPRRPRMKFLLFFASFGEKKIANCLFIRVFFFPLNFGQAYTIPCSVHTGKEPLLYRLARKHASQKDMVHGRGLYVEFVNFHSFTSDSKPTKIFIRMLNICLLKIGGTRIF